MLTTAQQKVKQELEELQIYALTQHYNKPVLSRKRRSNKKWMRTITSIILLMVTCTLLLKVYWTQKEISVTSYLTNVHDYNKLSERILTDFLTRNSGNIEQSKAQQEDLLIKVTNLKSAENFHEHQQDIITVFKHRLAMMTSFKDPDHSDQVQLNKSLIELSVKEELAADSLIKGFEQEKIKFKQKENGTVQYWINSKSYSLKN
ncbi:hypothetical protein [Bacillus sp. UNC41MFS5]|uniref:hypothetical protein n=1 Tax=Bacillus sp. UNC41MFS5 TaxID=1449046 RepID=UPI00047E254C|nr:hypothetical protein [Bacillus sp. UNC41MFS5]